jgi:hypothetical protein
LAQKAGASSGGITCQSVFAYLATQKAQGICESYGFASASDVELAPERFWAGMGCFIPQQPKGKTN